MADYPLLADIRFQRASKQDLRTGLVGYLSFRYGDVRLDGVTLRRTRAGELTLSFPAKRTREGREWPYVRPIDDETRSAIEAQVFAALGLASEGAR